MANTIQTQIGITGGDEVIATVDSIGDHAEATFAKVAAGGEATGAATEKLSLMGQAGADALGSVRAGAAAMGEAVANSGAAVENLVASLGQIPGVLGQVISAITGLIGANVELIAGLGGLAIAFKLGESASEATRALENVSAALGLTTQQMQGFQYAAATVGVSQDTLARSMERFTANWGKATDAAAQAAEKVAAAGDPVEKLRIATEKSNLAVLASQAAYTNSFNSVTTLTTGIDKAQLSVTKATEAYNTAATAQTNYTGTAAGLATAHQKVADSAASLKIAQDGLAATQTKLTAGNTAAGLALEKLRISQDEAALSATKTVAVSAAQNKAIIELTQTMGTNAEGLPVNVKAFLSLADSVSTMTDKGKVAEVMLAAFGKQWAAMLPLMLLGSAGILAAKTDFDQFGLALTDAQKVMGGQFEAAWAKLTTVFDDLKLQVGNIVGQIFPPLMDAISNFLVRNADTIRGIATGIADFVGPVLQAVLTPLGVVANIIMGVFRVIGDAADALAATFNEVFGTNISGGVIILTAALIAFGPPLLSIRVALVALGAALSFVWTWLVDTFGEKMASQIAGWAVIGVAAVWALGTAFSAVMAMLGGTAGTIGLPFTLLVVAIAAIVAGLVALVVYFPQVKAAAEAVYDWFVGTWVAVGAQMAKNWNDNLAFIGQIFNSIAQGIVTAWDATIAWIGKAALAVYHFVIDPWVDAFKFVSDAWDTFTTWVGVKITQIGAWIDGVVTKIEDMGRALLGLPSSTSNAGAAAGAAGAAFAGGGHVRGVGTPTSDSIFARLSAGEYVVRAAAVAHYGVNVLHSLNAMRLAPGFSMGGLAGLLGSSLRPASSPMRFAGGGVAAAGAPGHVLNLTIDGATFEGLTAPEAVGARLVTFARGRAIRSAGKKPSWYRG